MARPTQDPKGRRWHHLPWRNPRDRLTLTVEYRGGNECWVEVRSRGSMGRFHGATALIDVVKEITQWDRKPPLRS